MIVVKYCREGNADRCKCMVEGSVYEIAMEYVVLSKQLASAHSGVIELSKILLSEINLEDVEND